MNLPTLKSAVVLEDRRKILEVLKGQHEKAVAENPALANEYGVGEKDGEPVVWKASPRLHRMTIPTPEDVKRLATARGIEWNDALASRVLAYWMSDERGDSHGDVVRQQWDLKLYRTNPVMPWSHEWGNPPIGAGLEEEVRQREDADYRGPALWGLFLFALAEQYGFADTIYRLASGGFVRAGSVGFMPRRIVQITDEGERAAIGLGKYGVVLEDNVLLEFSACTLGANPGALNTVQALARAKQAGNLKAADFAVLRELSRRELFKAGKPDEWNGVDAKWRGVARSLFADFKADAHDDIAEPFAILPEEDRLKTKAAKAPAALPPPAPESKGRTAEDAIARIAALEGSVARLTSAIDGLSATSTEMLSSLHARLDDIASNVEDVKAHVEANEGTTGGGVEPTPTESKAPTGLRARALGAMNAVRGKVPESTPAR